MRVRVRAPSISPSKPITVNAADDGSGTVVEKLARNCACGALNAVPSSHVALSNRDTSSWLSRYTSEPPVLVPSERNTADIGSMDMLPKSPDAERNATYCVFAVTDSPVIANWYSCESCVGPTCTALPKSTGPTAREYATSHRITYA